MEYSFVPACLMLHVSFLRSEDSTQPDQRRCLSHKERQSVAKPRGTWMLGNGQRRLPSTEHSRSSDSGDAWQATPDCAVGRST
ncbi:hypothetical protein BU25DRAFT_412022 [Macroventuria anomochaeta]|uniref:Uncharacterized protein n=1 Tax=Macroventuria anomochaeta TaxID=301207 RepID=A0ACB6RW87_9PLEO|nr:uncharacterized protein BU25DRAFT_412022 [Macroventuria anomochaeta]KAF2626186.1 hypothetical protein BU25DRAFT_412022 [Macroventuria anomochaeta]